VANPRLDPGSNTSRIELWRVELTAVPIAGPVMAIGWCVSADVLNREYKDGAAGTKSGDGIPLLTRGGEDGARPLDFTEAWVEFRSSLREITRA